MKELLKQIGILDPGYFDANDNYIIDFESSDDYNKAFSKLDRSTLVKENEGSSFINTATSNVMYMNQNFILNMIADFDNDTYKLVITQLKEN